MGSKFVPSTASELPTTGDYSNTQEYLDWLKGQINSVVGSGNIIISATEPIGPVGTIWGDVSGAIYAAPSIGNIPNQAVLINTPLTIDILLADLQDVNACQLSVTSSDSAAIPSSAVSFGGTGTTRTMTVAGIAGAGTALLTVSALNTFTGRYSSASFTMVVALTQFTITASAGANGSLAPTGSVTVLQGQSKTFTATPSNGYTCSQLVVDGVPMLGVTTYTFNNVQAAHTISAVFVANTAPTITPIANQSVGYQTATNALAFTIGDAETDPSLLVVTKSSSNQTLVPDASIVIGGSGASRTVIATPANGQHGTATITLTVSDGLATTSTTFTVTVSNIIFEDNYGNASLDATNFGQSVGGSGYSIVESTTLDVVSTSSSGAITYYKPFNIADNYIYEADFQYRNSGDLGDPFGLMQSSELPLVASTATNVGKRRFYLEFTANSMNFFWMKPDGSTTNAIAVVTTLNTTYKVRLIVTGSIATNNCKLRMQFLSAVGVVLCDSGLLTVGIDIKNDSSTYYLLVGGDLFTDNHFMSLKFSDFKVTVP